MALIEVAKFPTAIASETDMLNWKNALPSGTVPSLSTTIGATDLAIFLSTGTGATLPTDNFVISIDDEVIFIESRTGDTCTVAAGGRGYESTTAAGHSQGASVYGRVTAKSHNQIVTEVNAIETALGTAMKNVVGLVHLNYTPVTVNSSTTAEQELMTWAMASGFLDVIGRAVRITVTGTVSTGGTACTADFKLALQSVATLANQTFSLASGLSNVGWRITMLLVRTATGVSGSFETQGAFSVDGATAGAAQFDNFCRSGQLTSIDATAVKTLKCGVTFSVASSSNVCVQRLFVVERLN